jgi:hypothetical protein
MGSAEQRTSGPVIVGSCMYVCIVHIANKLNSLADCSQSERRDRVHWAFIIEESCLRLKRPRSVFDALKSLQSNHDT